MIATQVAVVGEPVDPAIGRETQLGAVAVDAQHAWTTAILEGDRIDPPGDVDHVHAPVRDQDR